MREERGRDFRAAAPYPPTPTGSRCRGGTGNFSYVDNVEVQQWYHLGTKSAMWPQHTLTAMWTGPPDDPKAMPEQWLADYLHDEFGDSGVIWESAACLHPYKGTDEDRALFTDEAKTAFRDEYDLADLEQRLPTGVWEGGKVFQVPFEWDEDDNA